jgi:hypothetical protein
VRILLPALAVLALLTGCASAAPGSDRAADGTPAPGSGTAGGSSRPENDLAIDVDLGDGSARQSWTLVCAGVAEGTHPQPDEACAHLQGLDEPFAPIPADVSCTEQYGGPQTAHVTGVWGGEPVDLELSRVNGCFIGQWDSLGPLLPVDGGSAG